MSQLLPIMFAGTGSDVGKSVIATAFCRIFLQDGYHPAPFKAQNMALNSYATPEGLEIGRAQAVQAEAAGIPCHTDMNPLLLKPSSDKTSQVVLNGQPIGNQGAYDYFRGGEGREKLRKEVCAAFDRLAGRFNPIVMEGAGSIAEVNLRKVDLVNMPMAIHAGAKVILVADIDRGGVFASVYGSIMLLTEEERKHIAGIIINKFRGDLRLFDEGVKIIEDLCKVPVLGVLPFLKDIHIEEEDSVAMEAKQHQAQEGKVNVAVVLLSHLSNFTDFNTLERDDRIHLFYTNNTDDLRRADIIIIPGSKSTISDLMEIRRNGVAQAILQAYHDGKTIFGICGGYQMMGLSVADPSHIEGATERMPGLGLLPVETVIGEDKRTVQTQFHFLHYPTLCQGYEIHMGTSRICEPEEHDSPVQPRDASSVQTTPSPLTTSADGRTEGCYVNDRCMGTYMHGILDNPVVIDHLLRPFDEVNKERRMSGHATSNEHIDYATYKQQQYDLLAAEVRRHVDMAKIYDILTP